jgi:hypothetical protein
MNLLIGAIQGVLIGLILSITCMVYKNADAQFELPIVIVSCVLLCIVSNLYLLG